MNVTDLLHAAERAHKAGDLRAAVQGYLAVLRERPHELAAIFLAAIASYQLREYATAAALLRRVVHQAPAFAPGHYNLGTVLQEMGEFAEAERCFRRALKRDPTFAAAWSNLGTTLLALGDSLGAIRAFTRSEGCPAPTPEARFNRAFAYLLQGEFPRGFADYEHRWAAPVFRADYAREIPAAVWDGQPLGTRRLLVWAEQGYGDTIQMLRYWPQVRARAPFSTLEIQGPLLRLYAQQGIRAVEKAEPAPRCDAHVSLMSLPHLFGTTLDTVPAPLGLPGPRATLDTPAPNIGLCWAGTKVHRNDARRSLPAAALAPLLETPGVSWHLLQIERLDELAGVQAAATIRTYERSIRDFADTAALIRSLDLVITVDTAVAHLAATIGVPTWILLSAWPDWRWLMSRDDSPWYPAVRLFRQRRAGDWTDVVARVTAALPPVLSTLGVPDAAVA